MPHRSHVSGGGRVECGFRLLVGRLMPDDPGCAWFARIESQPGFMEDVEPYGANAAPGLGRSIYD